MAKSQVTLGGFIGKSVSNTPLLSLLTKYDRYDAMRHLDGLLYSRDPESLYTSLPEANSLSTPHCSNHLTSSSFGITLKMRKWATRKMFWLYSQTSCWNPKHKYPRSPPHLTQHKLPQVSLLLLDKDFPL